MKHILNLLFKWGVFGLTIFYIAKTGLSHWHEVQGLELNSASGLLIALAIALIIGAEFVIGLLWYWILDAFGQSISLRWTVDTIFKTTLAKYIPGSVWHLVGRIHASKAYDIPLELVSFSVLFEPLFMIAGGLIIALLCLHFPATQLVTLGLVAGILHPKGINLVFKSVQYFKHFNGKSSLLELRLKLTRGLKLEQPKHSSAERHKPKGQATILMHRYPWREIMGGVVYMSLKGTAFCLILACFHPLALVDLPQSISGFSLSWLLSIVLPAPGGVGVFEAAAMQVLDTLSNPEVLLSTVLTYRLVSVLAEMIGATIVVFLPVLLKLYKSNYHSLRATLMPSAN